MRLPSPSLPSSSGFLLCFFLPLSARAQSTVGSKTWLLSSACGQAREPAPGSPARHASFQLSRVWITAPHPHGSSQAEASLQLLQGLGARQFVRCPVSRLPRTWAVFRREKVGEKITSVTVIHCSIFRFLVNIVLP